MATKPDGIAGAASISAPRAAKPDSPPPTAAAHVKTDPAARVDKNAGSPDPQSGKKSSVIQKFSRKMPKNIGQYEIVAEINRGGMGIVYKAFDPNLRRHVAIKVLLAGEGASEEDIKRFQREAQATARLQHSNIVPIYAVGSHDSKPYFVMDFVEGRTAKQIMAEGQMTPRLALSITEGVAEALHHAHLNGVVHRDVKPGNIMVDEKLARAQLMDFGLARRVDEDLDITQAGTTMGTPSYMSPEQAEGKLSEVDGQSDVYSAGACLYEFLTGRPPFDGPTIMAVLRKVVDETPTPPRQINPKIHRDVDVICMKCLEHDKKSRYATAKQLAEDIRRFNAGEAILAKPLPLLPALLKKAKRHKEITIATALVILSIVVASSYAIWNSHNERQRALDDRQRTIQEHLDSGQRDLNKARAVAGELAAFSDDRGYVPAGESSEKVFEEKTALAKKAIVAGTTFFRQVENLEPDNAEARTGLEALAKLDNDVDVTSFIFQARNFLNPPRDAQQFVDVNPDAARYAAELALKRAPNNAIAAALRKQAVGIKPVNIESIGAQAEVFARRILDKRRLRINEPERGLGKTPVKGFELEPGLYLIEYRRPNLPVQQATLWVDRASTPEALSLRITINTNDENMVFIPAGTVRLLQHDDEAVQAFAIDRFEYPNKAGVQPKTLAEISKLEARQLCTKQGKKLCTAQQWVRACSGDEGRNFAYGTNYVSGMCATGHDIEMQQDRFASGYFARCRTPEGVYDMSGNLAEWTEIDQVDSDFGGDWTSSTKYANSTISCRSSTSADEKLEWKNYSIKLGFRCCK